jgi:hypothetical protein
MRNVAIAAAAVAVAAVGFIAVPAKAGTVYDASLVNPPGVYFGAGNEGSNVHWATTTTGTVEIGLQAIQRGVGANITPTGNVYHVPLGPDPTNGARAYWNFDLSVNLRSTGLGNSSLTLGDVIPMLTIQDVATGTLLAFNPFTAFPDNSAYTATGTTRNGNVSGQQATVADIGFQNSENLVFFPGLNYNFNTNDTFNIALSFTDLQNNSLGSVGIQVISGNGASPVPGPIVGAGFPGLVMAFGAGFAWYRRRKAVTA